jgi:hypothetical protein
MKAAERRNPAGLAVPASTLNRFWFSAPMLLSSPTNILKSETVIWLSKSAVAIKRLLSLLPGCSLPPFSTS